MKIDLTEQECNNVKVSLLAFAKRPDASEQAMAMLLTLSQKFNFKEETKEVKKAKNEK